ncbi:MAG: deoxyuridine 5'-triphosphate nucleotidohydrolase [Candidatus Aenigmarchaeota archaeon]|nr:deoxyuridine 5'-triphosphate nucleotidohydrolase [Candidatus Aenigmarchaeota archaeon]
MLLSKSQILEYVKNGFLVQNMIDPAVQIQQAGIDLTIGKIFRLSGQGIVDFSNEKRRLPEYEEIKPKNGKWILPRGTYNATMNEFITLPNNIVALVFPRSSALVCGIEVHTAVWDPGYRGRGVLHLNVQRDVTIYQNARIVQMIFMKTQPTEEYNGAYKNEDLLKRGRRGR